MNPAFWLLLLIALAILYFCIAFIFPAIGSIVLKVFSDFKSIVSNKTNNERRKT